ncbi:MAG: D-3-phosphoglycerate dehydrogenase [Devosia sp.]|jgi:lactate dehydrogenase-like 2-hydroxyacid dehydrogenase|nr:D-3-phosphoglycerate dehydrogenase [Devosia sp.]
MYRLVIRQKRSVPLTYTFEEAIKARSIDIGQAHYAGLIENRSKPREAPIRPTILVTKPLAKSCLKELEQLFDVRSIVNAADPDAIMAENAESIRAVAGGKVSAAMMAKLPKLEIIANEGVGVDTTDVQTAKQRGIAVTNTPDVLNIAVAELAVGLMLALARTLPQADRFVRDGQWAKGMFPLRSQLNGKTVGILGLGRIGKEIATRLTSFGMNIVYFGRQEQHDQPYRYFDDLEAMARESDWLVVIAPGGKATDGIVSRQIIEALGPEGRLVNVARGSLVDQAALIEALASGRLGGAALDVFEEEPGVPAELLVLDNVVVSPHMGSRTEEAREAMGRLVIDNLVAHFEGRSLPSRVA